jgi:NAD(P)-dependent dehydrogenase (short-subunit alcohol dehydrogenase family)
MNVFITGISKGLGLALAKEYTKRGDAVLGISRSMPEDLPKQVVHQADDVTSDEVKDVVAGMTDTIPCVDLLINNAGHGSSGFRADSVSISELSCQFQLHCVGALRVVQALLPKLRNAANPKVINITSRLGSVSQHIAGAFEGRDFSYPYRIAKCAQNMLTVCMAGDRSLDDLVVAAIIPGLLLTDSGSNDAEHTAEDAASRIVQLIQTIEEFGAYHAYNEPANLWS